MNELNETTVCDADAKMMSVVPMIDYPDAQDIGAGLGLMQMPVPKPGKDQVVIKVAYAGVNRADTLQAGGHYPPPKGITNVLGLECSGTIVAIGAQESKDASTSQTSDATDSGNARTCDDGAQSNDTGEGAGIAGVTRPLRVGDKVCAVVKGGGYGPYCVADAGAVLPLPAGYGLKDAAAIMEAVISAYYCLAERCRARGGETVLIHGGSGAVGTIAVQMAAAMQLHVITTAGSKKRCQALENLARCRALDYHDDVVAQVHELTGGQGVHCVIDVQGAGGLKNNLAMLRYGGRLMILGLQKGVTTDINLLVPMNKALEIHAGTMRNMPLDSALGLRERLMRDVWPMLREQDVVPVIDSVVPVAQAAKAHQRILLDSTDSTDGRAERPFGKIVLEVDPEL